MQQKIDICNNLNYNVANERRKECINILHIFSLIHEKIYIEFQKDILTGLLKIAKIQSSEYSTKIKSIQTANEKIRKIFNDKVEQKNRNEEEIAGYRDVLELIHENYENIDVTPNIVL